MQYKLFRNEDNNVELRIRMEDEPPLLIMFSEKDWEVFKFNVMKL